MERTRLLGVAAKLFGRFYPTAKALYMWRMKRAFDRYPQGPILLLQLGKVGSKSLQAGLEARIHDRAIYHAHFLSARRTARTEKQRRVFFRTRRQAYLQRAWQNQFLLRAIQDCRGGKRWKLISLTREPVGRNISAFFENLDFVKLEEPGKYQISSNYYEIEPTIITERDSSKLIDLFLARSTHDSALVFFEREIRDIFGIDVLAEGFPIAKGYGIYRGDKADLLVIRLEDLDRCAGTAIQEFLGLDDFELVNRNIAAEKIYAPMYAQFKKDVVLDSEYVDMLLKSDYMQTFYTSDEIGSVRRKWLRG